MDIICNENDPCYGLTPFCDGSGFFSCPQDAFFTPPAVHNFWKFLDAPSRAVLPPGAETRCCSSQLRQLLAVEQEMNRPTHAGSAPDEPALLQRHDHVVD